MYGSPARPAPAVPESPPGVAAAAFDGLPARIAQATEAAAADGAIISVAVLDRVTNQMLSNGNDQLVAIASVAKLFIADDLLAQGSSGPDPALASPDRPALDSMLRSSDDDAAETFWAARGGETIIDDVVGRYGLRSTTAPSDGRWWNTISSVPDLVHYYDALLDGSGGLSRERSQVIVNDLAGSTATGVDGYPQRFGIPDGLYAEPVAVKQGWMCCMDGADWMHLSTGIVGADRRYVMVIESLQPSDDATARATITQAVKTMFPSGGSAPNRGRTPQIGTAFAGPLLSDLPPPLRDAGMIAGQQHLGDVESAPARWPGVRRTLEYTPRMRIVLVRQEDCPTRWHQAQYRFDHDQRRGLASRQDVVSDRHLFDPHPGAGVLDDPLVDPLVTATREHQMRLAAPSLRGRLRE